MTARDGEAHTRAPTYRPLRPIGRRPTLVHYVAQMWQRRHFIYVDSRARAFSGNRDYLLGNLWLVGKPILDGMIYYLVFGLILRTSRGIDNFTGFLLIGVFLFYFTQRATNAAVTCLISNRNLVQSFRFPRASIPLAVLTRQTLSMAPVLGTLVVLLLVVPPRTEITLTWLLFPVVFALQVLFTTGVVLYAARLGSAIPDLKFLVGFVTRLWFYSSGVMFALESYVEPGFWLGVLQANPMYLVLDTSRDLLLYATVPTARDWTVLAAWAVLTPLLGFVCFWQGEESYDQHL